MSTPTITRHDAASIQGRTFFTVDYEDISQRALAWARAFAGPACIEGVYVGDPEKVSKGKLKVQKALLRPAGPGFVLAQFDDMSTGLGHGWHKFPEKDFTLVVDNPTPLP